MWPASVGLTHCACALSNHRLSAPGCKILNTCSLADLGKWIRCKQRSAAELVAEVAGQEPDLFDKGTDLPAPKVEALWGRTDVLVEAGAANFSSLVLNAPPGNITYLVFYLVQPQQALGVGTFPFHLSVHISLHHVCECN